MNRGRENNTPPEHSWDLIHEFFAVFLGVWASFVLTREDFSLLFAMAILLVTVVPVYRLVHAFHQEGRPPLIRWLFHYLPTLFGALVAVLAIAWLSEQFVADASLRPPLSQIGFLVIIIRSTA